MRKLAIAALLFAAPAFVFAQSASQGLTSHQAQSGGVSIQGNTTINANVKDQTATADGQNNTAKNTVGAIKGGTVIRGNTNITATAGNQTALAKGTNNKAENTVGAIGGN